jgi:hypothetical protein
MKRRGRMGKEKHWEKDEFDFEGFARWLSNKIFKELEIEQTKKRRRVHGTREESKKIFPKH